jgi:hypothetical protein
VLSFFKTIINTYSYHSYAFKGKYSSIKKKKVGIFSNQPLLEDCGDLACSAERKGERQVTFLLIRI